MKLDVPGTRKRDWKARTDKATATRVRNNALRNSRKGRLLLVLERCVLLNPGEWQRNTRAFKRVLEELRYACELAKAAGVPCGWLAVEGEQWLVAFGLNKGDVVFNTQEERLGPARFPATIRRDNKEIVAAEIAELLRQQPVMGLAELVDAKQRRQASWISMTRLGPESQNCGHLKNGSNPSSAVPEKFR